MMICLCIFLFFAVVASGPDGRDWLENRRARRLAIADKPTARVVYLPPSSCQPRGCPTHHGQYPCILLPGEPTQRLGQMVVHPDED